MDNKRKLRLIRATLLVIVFICLILMAKEHYLSVNHRIQQEELEQKLQTKGTVKQAGEEGPGKESVSGQEINEDEKARFYKIPGNSVIEELQEGLIKGQKEQEPVILDKYAGLYEENTDLTGWLSIEGMRINYPVMQCDDNEYYLHHDFYRREDKYGCLYVKDSADVNTPGTNFIIYGHNMRDGSMFGDLDLYKEEAFFKEHSMISFDTLYEERSYEIVAVFLSRVYREEDEVFKYYDFYKADTLEEFQDFYENIKNLSLYDTKVEAEYGDTFLTLSTCAYHVEDGRLVVVAKRIEDLND